MNINSKALFRAATTVSDVASGQVFSFESGSEVLLMTDGTKYVRLMDGSMGTLTISDMDKRVKIYEHELVLKAVK